MINAKIVEDSISPDGVRLTTFKLRYPRFIHSEFMTHRVFSRNASSSRAIPVHRMLKSIKQDIAIPVEWGSNKPGMQAGYQLMGVKRGFAKRLWIAAAYSSIGFSWLLYRLGVHKQITNRLTEPFQHISVVVTATEWDNFFKLRLHEDAQPEIRELALAMSLAMSSKSPIAREHHIPFVLPNEHEEYSLEELKMISAARCARTSYNNHDNTKPVVEKDLELANRLLSAGHLSPFEHQATVGEPNEWYGNFRGWRQFRKEIE